VEQRPVHPRRSEGGVVGALGLVAALALGGCSGAGTPSAPPAARPVQPQAVTPAAVTPAAVTPAPPVYAYDAKDRRDPFRPLIMPRVAPTPTAKRKTGPSVDELKLTGIIWDRRGAFALVEASNGAGYVLRVNDTIGEDARVAKITPDVVTIEVKPAVAAPNVPTRKVELRLRKEE
jgi:Tfp pilus assembly protein PilP